MPQRRKFSVLAALTSLLALPCPASAEQEPRVTVSAVTSRETLKIDGGEGPVSTGGARIALRLTRYARLQFEATTASGDIAHSYEGVFVSIAQPGASRAEIERLGVVLRRDRSWKPGLGAAMAVVLHTPAAERFGVEAAFGLAFRDIQHVDHRTLIRVPEGWDPSRSTGAGGHTYSRSRNGLMFGLAVPIHVTQHLTLAPEVRWTATVADEDYATRSLGVRADWRF